MHYAFNTRPFKNQIEKKNGQISFIVIFSACHMHFITSVVMFEVLPWTNNFCGKNPLVALFQATLTWFRKPAGRLSLYQFS